MLSAFLLSLEITQSGVKKKKKKRQKERERCRMTNLHEPDLNLQHYKFMAHPSLGWTMKTPRLISMASSVASRGPSSLLIWHFPSPWVNTFPARYCLASQPDKGRGEKKKKNTQTCALNFDKEWHPRLIMSRILGQSRLNGGMKFFLEKILKALAWQERDVVNSIFHTCHRLWFAVF